MLRFWYGEFASVLRQILVGGALLLSPPGAEAGEEDDRGSEAD